ncbi:MAG: Uncharacterised protein [Formosa sp. Hel1_33_131]|nr:MAG: Uncharacterised protein [Formosa sp. Hel1_33_131]
MKNLLFTIALLISFISFGQDDIKQGRYTTSDENGVIVFSSNYVDGILQGAI